MPERDLSPPPHGIQRYRRPWRCRCDECRAANSEYTRRLRNGERGIDLRVEDRAQREVVEQHGTRYWYNKHKCRCELCRQANRDYMRVQMRLSRQGIPLRSPIDEYLWD